MKSPGTFKNIKKEWYRYEPQKIFEIFSVTNKGLKKQQVKHNLEKFGKNILVDSKARNYFEIFISQFKNPLIHILILSSVVVWFLGHHLDSIIVASIVILNSIIGTIQEGKAEDTLIALKNYIKSYATVIRDGKEKIIDDTELVPGDLILLKDGGAVPADARLISTNSLKVNQSILTGESELVLKTSEQIVATNLQIADQQNMIFRGSYVVSGLATAIVIDTGTNTVIGKISEKLKEIKIDVPLKKKIDELSNLIVSIVSITAIVIFIFGTFAKIPFTELFLTIVAVTVASIPEALPVAVTLILTAGVWRMSQKNVLVKKLQSVEALGQATVIAVDKTGTITKNQMMVGKVFVNNRFIEITGSGYDQIGNFIENGQIIEKLEKDKDLDLIAKTSVFTATADLKYKTTEKEWVLERGDPTEASLLVLGKKYGYLKDQLENNFPKILEIPFDFNTKHHTTINLIDGKNILFTAGSPEIILQKCKYIWQKGRSIKMSELDLKKLETTIFDMTSEGYRVLALAINQKPPEKLINNNLPDLTFLGFVGIIDSIREEVYDSVNKVRAANIKVVMITGDHAKTAESIARKVGIFKEGDIVLTGAEIDSLSDESIITTLDKVTVFARVTPDHKMKIIDLFKKRGDVIAMTGDGINDALSLTEADLGISMGKGGTEVARQASDIILLDDNFGNIVEAAEEGRNIYWTIKKTILFLLSTNLGALIIIVFSVIAGMPLPLVAAQIIWLNLVTDTFLNLALIFDPKEKNIMSEEYRSKNKNIFDTLMVTRLLSIAILMALITLTLFNNYLPMGIEKATTIALTTLTVLNIFNIFNVRSHIKSIFSQNIFENKYLIGSVIIATSLYLFSIYTPFMQKILKTTALDLNDWLIILGVSISIIVVEEIRKYISRISFQMKDKNCC
jgi:P-type Ca2+ transporter type 2C